MHSWNVVVQWVKNISQLHKVQLPGKVSNGQFSLPSQLNLSLIINALERPNFQISKSSAANSSLSAVWVAMVWKELWVHLVIVLHAKPQKQNLRCTEGPWSVTASDWKGAQAPKMALNPQGALKHQDTMEISTFTKIAIAWCAAHRCKIDFFHILQFWSVPMTQSRCLIHSWLAVRILTMPS